MDTQEPTIIDLSAKRHEKRQPLQATREKLRAKLKRSTHGAYRSDQVCPERLIMARELLGFSQDDWAEILGVLPMEYKMWEVGTAQPAVDQLSHLAEITGMFKSGWFCQPVESGWPDIEQTSLRFH